MSDPVLLRLVGPVAVALIVFVIRRWGPIAKVRVSSGLLPYLAAAVGIVVELTSQQFGWTSVDRDALDVALQGAIGYGLAGAGAWGLTGVVRKPARGKADLESKA